METFFRKKSRPRQSSLSSQDAHDRSLRPLSYSSIATSRSGESSRQSRVSPSLSPLESQHTHLSSLSHHLHRLAAADEFQFPRPDDEKVEAMFQNIMRSRGLDDLPNVSIDQKWSMVWSDEQLRWKEERQREEQIRKQHYGSGQPPSFAEGTPEWYIKKFLDKTITSKQATGLGVSLRSKDVDWFRDFISLQGTSVLAQTLLHISRKGPQRRKDDIDLEYEIAKCLKHILNQGFAIKDLTGHPQIVMQMTASLNSPHLLTKKIIVDVLTGLTLFEHGQMAPLVLEALESLSTSNGEPASSYAYWFKSLESLVSGRGKMGTRVGASEEVKKNAGQDASLNEYAVSNLFLILAILNCLSELDVRVHQRSQMEAAGLQRILALSRSFGVQSVDFPIDEIEKIFAEDEDKLRAQLDSQTLRDLSSVEDVYHALKAKTDESKAKDYLLSMLQHLLLVREEGADMVHTFQVLDTLVTDVVMDKRYNRGEQKLGQSVARIIAQLNEADRYQQIEAELAKANGAALHYRHDKEVLEAEIAQGSDGLVGTLKERIVKLEEKLQVSRDNTSRLKGQLETQKAGYEEQIAQLEAQIMELFRMLKEVGKGVNKIFENAGGMDRKTLIDTLEKHFERNKTISILEGRDKRKKKGEQGQDSDEDDLEDESTPKKTGSLRRTRPSQSKGRAKSTKTTSVAEAAAAAHTSQFMDADDALVQEQIQQQLAEGAMVLAKYPNRNGPLASPRSVRGSPRRKDNMRPPLGEFVASSSKLSQVVSDDLGSERSIGSVADEDMESDFGRTSSTRSGFSTLTDPTSVSSATSVDSSRTGTSSAAPSAPSSARSSTFLGQNINNLLSARKDLSITPSTKMKQLQWDKLPQQQAAKTVFSDDEPTKEEQWMLKLQSDGVWREMEEDFKAKQLVINLMAKQKRAELKSVLDPQTKKRVEILIQTVKRLQPEEIAMKIRHFDQVVCTPVFLSELKPVLPNPEQVGKLNVYRHADPEELAGLHPSDRLMVQLIKLDRLAPRIEGMLYKCTFEETWSLLDDSARKLSEAGNALLHAKHFKELLSLILLIGNYMNGTGVKGGAFGFRVSSINKLVDTKSVHNTTLLHFLERTVAKHFPDMEAFLDELSAPAEAYRVSLQDVRKSLGELREGLKSIRRELTEHFADAEQTDRYGAQMWAFVREATSQVEDLVDDVNNADAIYLEVVKYYGEDDKQMNSTEFYGTFKTFVTSYKKCKSDNQAIAEERLAAEKRRHAAEESKANRQKAIDDAAADESEDTAVLDNLLEKLRSGDTASRKARRTRPNTVARPAAPLSLDPEALLDVGSGDATVDIAKDMLARLKSDGFSTHPSSPSSTTVNQRRSRRRLDAGSVDLLSEEVDALAASEQGTMVPAAIDDEDSAAEEYTLVGSVVDHDSVSGVS
ncbi:uncharacterized protein C8Q71DRAFT_716099 [Rhodofomes roseus]|uniref:FH2 domain-containing protein n=1 Tax=Rhodofomes roseus TaxID=34475 RepID=A0ABQ8K2D6_9APHY|nr:uncharacterized protein C8Q71DRAFT_716099 [Rhodofomes roseus]KAH9830929.1 hypothetical protein C8Q71DRAFT_716099 [Rhodofomes roseus]